MKASMNRIKITVEITANRLRQQEEIKSEMEDIIEEILYSNINKERKTNKK